MASQMRGIGCIRRSYHPPSVFRQASVPTYYTLSLLKEQEQAVVTIIYR
jgi:hypothetical protein